MEYSINVMLGSEESMESYWLNDEFLERQAEISSSNSSIAS